MNSIFDTFLWQVNIKWLETIFIRRAPQNECPWEKLLHKLWLTAVVAAYLCAESLCELVHRFPSEPKASGSVLRTRTARYSNVVV